MSNLVESDARDASASLSSKLCEITGIDQNLAQALIISANGDLNVAVDMFFSDPDRYNEVPVVVIHSDEKDSNSNNENMIKVNANDFLAANIIGEVNKVNNASASKEKEKGLNEDANYNDKNMIKENAKNSLEVDNTDADNVNKPSSSKDKAEGLNEKNDVMIKENAKNSLEVDNTDADNVNKPSSSKDKAEGLNEKNDVYDEEKMLEKALKDSEKEFQLKEPDPLETFEVLSRNFPHIDSTALRKLCEDYSGRSQELETFVQHHIYTLPTKIEAEKVKLNAQLEELVAAGVEEAKDMIVENCPGCNKPKIVEHGSVKVFVCENLDCKGEFCRKCQKAQHIPDPCGGQETKVKLWDEAQEFQIINMKAKRSFDEEDELDREFRLAEGQFMRLNGLNNMNYKIESIDLVLNKKLEAKFEAKKEELKKQGTAECLLLFHGTPQKNIQPILENNFDLTIIANGRAYGDGVYFSEYPEVSLGYSRDQKSLILCKVLKGKNCTETLGGGRKGKRKKGQEMARCWAIVVPDVDQILPKYVINFS